MMLYIAMLFQDLLQQYTKFHLYKINKQINKGQPLPPHIHKHKYYHRIENDKWFPKTILWSLPPMPKYDPETHGERLASIDSRTHSMQSSSWVTSQPGRAGHLLLAKRQEEATLYKQNVDL